MKSLVWWTPMGQRRRSVKPCFIVRGDGRVERVCEHGVGHPVGHVRRGAWQPWMSVHGCEGCCGAWDEGGRDV